MRPQLGAKRVYQVAGECRDFHSFLFSLDRLEGCESFIRLPLSPVATRADERVATAAIRSIINPRQNIQRNDLMLHESANFILHAARDRPFRCKYASYTRFQICFDAFDVRKGTYQRAIFDPLVNCSLINCQLTRTNPISLPFIVESNDKVYCTMSNGKNNNRTIVHFMSQTKVCGHLTAAFLDGNRIF